MSMSTSMSVCVCVSSGESIPAEQMQCQVDPEAVMVASTYARW